MENFYFSLVPNNQIYSYFPLSMEDTLSQTPYFTKQIKYQAQNNQFQNYEMLKRKYQQLQRENQQLKDKIAQLNTREVQSPKRIVKRRKDQQIQKQNKCPYGNCKKWYGSEMALNLHMKEKHNGGSKKDRQELAKKILLAQKNHEQLPKSQIVLPPGFVQEYKKQLLQQLNNSKNLLGEDEESQNYDKKIKRQYSQ